MTEILPVNTELIKPEGVGTRRAFSVINGEMKKLLLGGREGKKYELDLQNSPSKRLLPFIVKELEIKDDKPLKIRKTARSYQLLYSMGYPVPATARYFRTEEKDYLVMSDMTENGKYWLWGWSDGMTSEQLAELGAMNLSDSDLQRIREMVFEVAKRAGKDRIWLDWYNYHIRKHKKTGEIDVVLLDVSPHNSYFVDFRERNSADYAVEDTASFTSRLEEEVEKAREQK